jgi:thiol-disulfide isomerase/thioredoxin
MKKTILTGLCLSAVLVTGVSAMTEDTMMKKDAMTKDVMMDKNVDAMVKKDLVVVKGYKKMGTAALASVLGYNWKKDRPTLAEKSGIKEYTGTIAQNLLIRAYLVKMIKDVTVTTDTKKVETVKKEDKMMKDEAMVKKEDSVIMKKDEAMVKIAGSYSAYSSSAVTAALAAKKNVVLFFHASWCPSCKEANANFLKETAPANTAVFKVDYDTSKDLKVKYGVTSQHTFVSLNADETLKKKSSGAKNFVDLAGLN